MIVLKNSVELEVTENCQAVKLTILQACGDDEKGLEYVFGRN